MKTERGRGIGYTYRVYTLKIIILFIIAAVVLNVSNVTDISLSHLA